MANDVRLRHNLMRGFTDTTLTSGVTSTDSFDTSDIAALFDDYRNSYPGLFHISITLGDAAGGAEIIYVTDCNLPTNNDLTIVRGQENTTDTTWVSGTPWTISATVRDFPQIFGGTWADPAANTNPTFSSTAGVWTTLPHTPVGNDLITFQTTFTGDLLTVGFSLLAKVTSGASVLALDVLVDDGVTPYRIGEDLGMDSVLAITQSTSYVMMHPKGSTFIRVGVPRGQLILTPVYLATGAGTFGCDDATLGTNVPVMMNGSLQVQGFTGWPL